MMSGETSDAAEPVRRTAEIEDVTNLYFIHPIASRLTSVLAASHVPPNAVSVAGMAFGILAGIAYNHYRNGWSVVAGFILMIAWHVMDGADGQLARLTHSQSQSGKVLDGICDYVTFIAVYIGLALALNQRHGGWVWVLVIVSGLCHAAQSAAYEAQRQEYGFWGDGRRSMNLLAEHAPLRHDAIPSLKARISGLLHHLYIKAQFLAAGDVIERHKTLAEIMRREPEREAAIRRRYREVFAPMVRSWSILSANYRTLAIFIFALFKAPLYFFWFEIVGLSLVLVILRARQPARYRRFFRSLDSAS